jgi:hypothetical protein
LTILLKVKNPPLVSIQNLIPSCKLAIVHKGTKKIHLISNLKSICKDEGWPYNRFSSADVKSIIGGNSNLSKIIEWKHKWQEHKSNWTTKIYYAHSDELKDLFNIINFSERYFEELSISIKH